MGFEVIVVVCGCVLAVVAMCRREIQERDRMSQFETLAGQLDAAATAVAGRIDKLTKAVQDLTAQLAAAQAAGQAPAPETLAALEATRAKLEALAAG